MEETQLNENDKKLLAFCKDIPRTITMIAEYLGIASKNVSVRLDKLKQMKQIEIKEGGKGKPTFVRTANSSKVNDYILTILKRIKNKESISDEELHNILEISSVPEKNYDKYLALTTIPYVEPPLISKRYVLTEEGLKFIKQHDKS